MIGFVTDHQLAGDKSYYYRVSDVTDVTAVILFTGSALQQY